MNKTHLTLSLLKSGKWTDMAIKKFLGEPDKTAPNPYSRSRPPMKLFLKSRVDEAEKSNEFISWFEKTKENRAATSKRSKATAERKKEDLLNFISNIKIEIIRVEAENLKEKAITHYQDLWDERGDCREVENNAPKSFIDRITVNMLRHEYSSYENQLCLIFGKIGVNEGYVLLKNRVLDKISETYPELEEECERQKI